MMPHCNGSVSPQTSHSYICTYINNTDVAGNLAVLSETDNTAEGFLARLYCIYFTSWSRIVPFTSVLCVFCAYIVRCSPFSGQHTASQHVFPSRVVRNRRCAYSMSRSENHGKRRPEKAKGFPLRLYYFYFTPF